MYIWVRDALRSGSISFLHDLILSVLLGLKSLFFLD